MKRGAQMNVSHDLVEKDGSHHVACDLMVGTQQVAVSDTAARDPLYLFACHLEWRDRANLAAYQELMAALDDTDESVRSVAEALIHRLSPRPLEVDSVLK
jgi:hypothetical protein